MNRKKTNRKSKRTNEQVNIQTKKTNGPKQIRRKTKDQKEVRIKGKSKNLIYILQSIERTRDSLRKKDIQRKKIGLEPLKDKKDKE